MASRTEGNHHLRAGEGQDALHTQCAGTSSHSFLSELVSSRTKPGTQKRDGRDRPGYCGGKSRYRDGRVPDVRHPSTWEKRSFSLTSRDSITAPLPPLTEVLAYLAAVGAMPRFFSAKSAILSKAGAATSGHRSTSSAARPPSPG